MISRLFSVVLLLVAGLSAALADPRPVTGESTLRPLGPDDPGTRIYIVELTAPPAVAEPSLQPAARPSIATASRRRVAGARPARRFDARSPAVRRYADQLTAQHDSVLAAVNGQQDKVYSYRYTFNGFAARMTEAQARKLRNRKDVRNVWEDRRKFVATNASSAFLGLTDPTDGLRQALNLRGEGVIIGVIDSGITPGHPSFSDRRPARSPRVCRTDWARNSLLGLWLCQRFRNREDEIVYTRPADWQGTCEAGQNFRITSCNNKLIGARYYLDGFLDQYDLDPGEFISPADADGHGTHIASTAAGNSVQATLGGTRVARISGVAPRAHIAAYKACWLEPGQIRGTCSTADLTRAIEDAVADGVDIINYSVGSYDDINDPDDLALLAAANAGVLTVAAAGNEGPMPGSMLSPAAAPWVLAVGSSSRRGDEFREAIRVNSPASIRSDYLAIEAGFTPRLRDAGTLTRTLVLANDGVTGSFDGEPGTTDDACESLRNSALVDGRIALVRRGGCTFVTKVRNAQNAGASAVVVFSNQGEPVLMTGSRGLVSIPALMIGREDGDRLRDRLVAGDSVEVTLDKSLILRVSNPGNQMQAFSARGPSIWEPRILKPDVTAPGENILAGQSPDVANNVRGENFQYLSGTSMSVPHVAGIAALLREAHPDWTPAMLRSAIVTTARQDIRREDGETAADPFDFGAGHVQPNPAVAPGLVYDAGAEDYDAFLCGRGEAPEETDCAALAAAGFSDDASDLNQPSIALDTLVNAQVVRRRVTNVGPPGQFLAEVTAPSTIDVQVSPAMVALNTGETAEVLVSFAVGDTTFDAWQFGALTWTGGDGVSVRSPLAIRALRLAAPVVEFGSGTAGSTSVALRVGYSGPYTAVLSGLEAANESQPASIQAQLQGATVRDDPDDTYEFIQPGDGTLPQDVRRIPLIVPAGTRYLRVALFNERTTPGADLDLYLYSCPGFTACVAQADPSFGPDSNEAINLIPEPGENFVTPGEYYVDVHGFNTVSGIASFDLFVWTVGADRGNATVTGPGSVTNGLPASVTVDWQDLTDGLYLGLLTHTDGSRIFGRTVLEIDSHQ